MSNYLLATYDFYPYSWGGSEVYVEGLARYLQHQGASIRIISATTEQAFFEHGIHWQGSILRICRYSYQGLIVYGCLHPLSTQDIYSKYQPSWEADWVSFFNFLQHNEKWEPSLLHLHGFTAIIGLALVKAFRHKFLTLPIHASYHTPISCPKGTLLYFEKSECDIKANVKTCTACTWQAKTGWPQSFANFMAFILPPKNNFEQLPTALKWKGLIQEAIESFQELIGFVDQWWVFSQQIYHGLLAQGVAENKIAIKQHGVSSLFTSSLKPDRLKRPYLFAFVGRFKKIKGLLTLLQAWEKLPQNSDRILWLIGDEKEAEPEIKELLFKLLKTRKDVVLLGKKTPKELVDIYEKIHALVIPSEWVEIGPLVFHESIACGANVIASDIGGNKELAEYYGAGCHLFRTKDSLDLCKKILAFEYQKLSHEVTTDEEHLQQISMLYP